VYRRCVWCGGQAASAALYSSRASAACPFCSAALPSARSCQPNRTPRLGAHHRSELTRAAGFVGGERENRAQPRLGFGDVPPSPSPTFARYLRPRTCVPRAAPRAPPWPRGESPALPTARNPSELKPPARTGMASGVDYPAPPPYHPVETARWARSRSCPGSRFPDTVPGGCRRRR
jgi:hypothetical protein